MELEKESLPLPALIIELEDIVLAYAEGYPLEKVIWVEYEDQKEANRTVITVCSVQDDIKYTKTWQVGYNEINKKEALVHAFKETPVL